MNLVKVDKDSSRTPEEEYEYWFNRVHGFIEESLPWDMHPNEVRAEDMYRAKLQRKMVKALASIDLKE